MYVRIHTAREGLAIHGINTLIIRNTPRGTRGEAGGTNNVESRDVSMQ